MAIRSVTLDVADTYQEGELQDQAAELIWRLLERNYHIFLVSTNPDRPVQGEEFEHPGLEFVRAPMPPDGRTRAEFPALLTAGNLWVTDDPALSEWAIQAELPLATRVQPPVPGGTQVARIGAWRDLGTLLQRTLLLLREIEQRVGASRTLGAKVIALGGPPLSGFGELALELKQHLEGAGYPLVELLNLGTLLRGTALVEEAGGVPAHAGRWASPEAGRWLGERLLRPARAGDNVVIERLPAGIPEAFAPHLPLFLSADSIVLAFAEMPFQGELREHFDLAVLLETAPEETTRRIYELDEAGVDPKFTDQYLAHEGAIYRAYLEKEGVAGWADLRVDANVPGVFTIAE